MGFGGRKGVFGKNLVVFLQAASFVTSSSPPSFLIPVNAGRRPGFRFLENKNPTVFFGRSGHNFFASSHCQLHAAGYHTPVNARDEFNLLDLTCSLHSRNWSIFVNQVTSISL